MNADAGISFMLRAHNEEATLEECIRSLKTLTVPHEIVVILHCCTDGSRDIAERLAAEEGSRVSVLEYTHALSRAGYEHLATDVDSVHSMSYYTSWCRAQCQLPWVFKWDADFIASPQLIAFLNSQDWSAGPPKYYRIAARNEEHVNAELYCCRGVINYGKYLFWEVPSYLPGEIVELNHDIHIYHKSTIDNLKTYWRARPWFAESDEPEAVTVRSRVERLVADYGPEPEGMARARNPACDTVNLALITRVPNYVNFHA